MNCAGCLHRNRDLLDAQLIQGIPYRTLANTFHLSLGAISRHKRHVKEMIRERTIDEREEHGSTLYIRAEKLVAAAEEILEAAKAKNDFRAMNGALGVAAKLLDLLGRVSGELQSAHSGGIHLNLTSNRISIKHGVDDDTEFAQLISEATNGFDPAELLRLQRLVARAVENASFTELSVKHAFNDPPIALNPKQ